MILKVEAPKRVVISDTGKIKSNLKLTCSQLSDINLNKYYVYHHLTSNGDVFYVGKGIGIRAISTDNRNLYWHNTTNKEGCVVKIIHFNLDEETAYKLEKEEIKKYGLKLDGGKLVNLTPGGEGSAGYKWTNEQKENLKPKRTGSNNSMYGKQFFGTDNPNYGNKYGDNPLSKPLVQLDFNGNYVTEFTSLSEVEKNGYNPSAVGACCKGKRLQHKGFIFIYKEHYNPDNPPKYKPGKTSKRAIIGIDKINKTYKLYESSQASIKDGFNAKVVNACCNKTKKSHRGIEWFFYDEVNGDDLLRYSLVTSES